MTGEDPIARRDDRRGAAFALGHDDDLRSGTSQPRRDARRQPGGGEPAAEAGPARATGPERPGHFAALVLAAGAAERFGITKQLAEVAGRPLIAHAVATAREAGADPVVVVVGHEADEVARAARAMDPDVEVISNPAYRSGQASSLVAGIRWLAAHHPDQDVEVAVVLLADQPGVTPAAVFAVATALARVRGPGGARPDAARASYADGLGHPVAFRRPAWARLVTLTGDVGARHLLEDLEVVHVRVAGSVPADVDTPADLQRLVADQRPGAGPDAK